MFLNKTNESEAHRDAGRLAAAGAHPLVLP